MRAVTLKGYGDNSKLSLSDRPRPKPAPEDVLIRVHAAGVNPVDYKIRNGDLRLVLSLRFPHVMGNEVAGTVDAIGEKVSQFKVGDDVYARLDKARMGGFAEYVCENVENIALKPSKLGFDEAAGVPLAALTAWQALHEVGNIQQGHKILIHGGGGSVGRFAIQFAKAAGAEVFTTVSEWAETLVRELGADHVIHYRKGPFEAVKEQYDLVFDLVGGKTLDRSFSVMKPGGIVISIAGVPEPNTATDLGRGWPLQTLFWLISSKLRKNARKAGVSYRFVFMRPSGTQLADIARLIDAQKIRVSLDRRFELEQYDEALAYQESGNAKGKVVLQIT